MQRVLSSRAKCSLIEWRNLFGRIELLTSWLFNQRRVDDRENLHLLVETLILDYFMICRHFVVESVAAFF